MLLMALICLGVLFLFLFLFLKTVYLGEKQKAEFLKLDFQRIKA